MSMQLTIAAFYVASHAASHRLPTQLLLQLLMLLVFDDLTCSLVHETTTIFVAIQKHIVSRTSKLARGEDACTKFYRITELIL